MIYTVIGFYPDTNQRWASSYEATSAGSAERKARDEYPDVAIVATLLGDHQIIDCKTYVTLP